MPSAIIYAAKRFGYRLFQFARHWYVKSGKMYADFVLNRLERLDRYIAWRVTLRYLFHPLYGDYSFIGRFFGFWFRVARLFVGSIVYGVIFFVALLVYFIWLLFPLYVIARIING